MIEYSDVTGKKFDSEDAVYYRNVLQSAWMMTHPDCVLLDVFTDGDGKLVFCFPREQHDRWIKDWANRPHETKDR